jgi:SOS-response transcriptional repressor LexA
MPSRGPTLAQLELLRAIWDLTYEKGWPPTVRELLERLGHVSTNGCIDKLKILQREGWIVRDNLASRCIKLTSSGFRAAGITPENPYALTPE